MTASKVPLVIYENGHRKVIGEAVVDVSGEYIDVSGVITDDNYQDLVKGPPLALSLSGWNGTLAFYKEPDEQPKKGKKSKANKPH